MHLVESKARIERREIAQLVTRPDQSNLRAYSAMLAVVDTFFSWVAAHNRGDGFSENRATNGALSFAYRLRHIQSHDDFISLWFSTLGIAHNNGVMAERLSCSYSLNGERIRFTYDDLNKIRNSGLLHFFTKDEMDTLQSISITHLRAQIRRLWKKNAGTGWGSDQPYGYFKESWQLAGREYTRRGFSPVYWNFSLGWDGNYPIVREKVAEMV